MSGTVVPMHSLRHVHHDVPKEDIMRLCCLGGLMTYITEVQKVIQTQDECDNEALPPAVTL